MKKQIVFIGLFLMLLTSSTLFGQIFLNRDSSINVISAGKPLMNPWAGGMTAPVFAEIDLNGDGRMDLITYDWIYGYNYRLNCYLNLGINSSLTWVEAPEYRKCFPKTLEGWVCTYDYDCDGDLDLFTYYISGGIQVYRNNYNSVNGLSFSAVPGPINSYINNFSSGIFVTRVDMPAFTDTDNDGDMDILHFSSGGSWYEHEKNLSTDSAGSCSSFSYIYNIYGCWGYFSTDPNLNTVKLSTPPPGPNANPSCFYTPANPFRAIGNNSVPQDKIQNRHSGTASLAIDMDGDGDKDILVGDVGGNNLLYVENCGVSDSAFACSFDLTFPSYDVPASMSTKFPAPYYFDADNDGRKDLIVANFVSTGEDYNNVFYYKNTSTTAANVFALQTKRFLGNTMIEVGTASKPTLVDINGDGLKDLIVGNDAYLTTGKSQLSYFKNIGTSAKAKFEFVTNDFANLTDTNRLPTVRGMHPAFGDLDNDGDLDMIIGEEGGTLIYLQNIGNSTSPNFIISQTYYQSINAGANAAPQLIDVDRDGKIDLLVGRRNGKIAYYHNSGTLSSPVFTLTTNYFGGVNVNGGGNNDGYNIPCLYDVNGSYQLLAGSINGYLYHYENIDGNLTGTFTVDSVFQNVFEPIRSAPVVGDLDGDSKYDLIVGSIMGGLTLYTQNPTLQSVHENTFNNSSFTLYPNPVNEQLLVKMDNMQSNDKMNVEVMNVIGETVIRLKSIDLQFGIDVSGLSSGTYLCKITTLKGSFCQKFIKL